VLHVARSRGEGVWYSHATTKELLAANELVRTQITDPMRFERRIDFSPARIVHLASSSQAVAALIFHPPEGTSVNDIKLRWSVVVIDDDGSERWRADVPPAFTPTFLRLNQVGFVAISEHRVVLLGEGGQLLAWDAANGAVIS